MTNTKDSGVELREAFEEWAESQGLPLTRHSNFYDDYAYQETQFSWLAVLLGAKLGHPRNPQTHIEGVEAAAQAYCTASGYDGYAKVLRDKEPIWKSYVPEIGAAIEAYLAATNATPTDSQLKAENERLREFYEADKAVSKIYDEVSPGLNTPKPQEHFDRLGAAIRRRVAAVHAIEQALSVPQGEEV